MKEAISYKRFSTRKQQTGDSIRRQTDLTEEYCRRNGLTLLDTYLDAGLSAFTGANLCDDGALKALLQAARAGKFRPGTALVVESLGRLSRQQITTAVRLFLDILDTGLVIVTLIDGEQTFTKERVDTDLTALIIAIVYLSRANNESRHRSERALQAQQTARRKARETKRPMTAECPAWLTVIGKGRNRRFVVNNERARVVEAIYTMSASGLGQYPIAGYLNQHHVHTFSGKPKWRAGMVAHVLRTPAVIGVFQPCRNVIQDGKRRRVPDADGPITGYFPSIITEELYLQGRLATKARLRRGPCGRRIPAYSNLAAKLGRCAACGEALHHFQNVGGWAYLRCANSRYGECVNRFGFPYAVVENILLALADLMEVIAFVSRASHLTNATSRTTDMKRRAFYARFREWKKDAHALDTAARDAARHSLIAELRSCIEGIVLHSRDCVTIHTKLDANGHSAVFLLERDGLKGIQLLKGSSSVGFIDALALDGIIPVVVPPGKQSAPDAAAPRKPNLDHLLARIQIAQLPQGGWYAFSVAARTSELIAHGENVL